MQVREGVSHRIPPIFSSFAGEVIAAESTRHGGVSKAPYQSLNLGLYTDDDPVAVNENRRRFFAGLGFSEEAVAGAHQVHGDQILAVDAPGQYEGVDALITDRPGLFLTTTVADCTPVLVYDPVRKAVAAIHAGWRGTAARIVYKTIREMTMLYRTHPGDCYAYIGTCIDECDYEVDADVADHFPKAFRRWDGNLHKFFLDLKAANKAQLIEAGLPEEQIGVSPYSTVANNEDYFSHRKEKGRTGRMLGVIGMKEVLP